MKKRGRARKGNAQNGKEKNSLFQLCSFLSLFFLFFHHGQPHRRAGRGVQSTSHAPTSWELKKQTANEEREARPQLRSRQTRDGSLSSVAASSFSLSLFPFLVRSLSCFRSCGKDAISTPSVQPHANHARSRSGKRKRRFGKMRDTTIDLLTRPLLHPTPLNLFKQKQEGEMK